MAIEPQVYIPGGTLIFSYIHRLGPFLGVPNFEFQYFFWGGGGSENLIFFCFGYEDFVDIFGVSSQNWTVFRSNFYARYGLFLRSR